MSGRDTAAAILTVYVDACVQFRTASVENDGRKREAFGLLLGFLENAYPDVVARARNAILSESPLPQDKGGPER